MPAPRFPSGDALRLSLRRRPGDGPPERLWVIDGRPGDVTRDLCGEVGERALGQFQAAGMTGVAGACITLIRPKPGAKRVPVLAPAGRGYCEHPTLPGVFLPVGYELRPLPRADVLGRLVGARPGTIVWVTRSAGCDVTVHRAPTSGFRPMADGIAYTVPAARRLVVEPAGPTFPLPTILPNDEHRAAVEVPAPVVLARPPLAEVHAAAGSAGWVRRLAARWRTRREDKPDHADDTPPETLTRAAPADHRPLLARRKALEQRVLSTSAGLPPGGPAGLWADLAAAYDATAEPAEAAVCWINAVWDHPAPAAEWLARWVRAEEQVAVGSGRLARVAAARLASTDPAAADGLVKLLDAHEGEVPVRAVWLARTAARVSHMDALGLTRCRDRLFRRLADGGPGLGLDVPGFLRFVGTTGDRGPAVRDWLVQAREPVHRWLERLAPAGSLQWAGIDPEPTATAALADLLLAWGLARVADRDRVREWVGSAAGVLDRPGATVHRLLWTAYHARIQAALDGRPDDPGLSPAAAAMIGDLDDLGRFAVERLRAASGILEPLERASPYLGTDLSGFLGDDELGDQLRTLVTAREPPAAATVKAVLAAVANDPTATALPRSVLVLLELAPRLGSAVAADVVAQVVRAVDLLPEWVRLGRTEDEPAATVRRHGQRMWAAAAHAARLFHLTGVWSDLLDELRSADPSAPSVVAATRTAGPLFRTCRRLGLTGAARELLAAWPPPRTGGVRDLGLAVGRFAVGDLDEANRSLDAGRSRLFARTGLDIRKRTELAFAYTDALGHAPVGLALGRLAELFARLGPIHVQGATNRYFTLQPLGLIDAAVRAVVGDEFGVGPAVRGWLDDDEYLIRRRITRDLDAILHAG